VRATYMRVYTVTKNGVRSILSTVRLKAVNEEKSTKSAGRLFHTLMTRMLKNEVRVLLWLFGLYNLKG